jgi:hypothetical protein
MQPIHQIFAILMRRSYELPIKALKDHGWWLASCDLEIVACFHVLKLWHSNLPSSTGPLCISELDNLTWYLIHRRGVVYGFVWQGTMITSTNHVVSQIWWTTITTPILKATCNATSPIFLRMPSYEGYMKAGAANYFGGDWTNLEI